MNTSKKVAVAMSGGVDSSTVAALMVKEYGKENVFGVTMKLFCYGEKTADEKSCCSLEAINDAKNVCEQIGIPHYVVNMEKEFEQAVIREFVSEYQKGRTPIPCVACNAIIKFEYLLKKVEALGAELLATGHYVKTELKEDGWHLLRGVDETKDQSYFLYGLGQEQLTKSLFPLGGTRKTEVRKEATKLSLKTAGKKESQGICFVVEGRVTDYLLGRVDLKPGEILTTKGEKVGEHEGIIFYTVGQRKRIGGGYSKPMYVVRIDAVKNQVIIGDKEELSGKKLTFEKAQWVSGEPPQLPFVCSAKIRYNMEDEPCMIQEKVKGEGRNALYLVNFKNPQRAITPGQSIVFYQKEDVIGGGIIDSPL